MALEFELKLTGVDGVYSMLQKLPSEVVSKRGGPAKKALRKGAVVILKEAKKNLRASITQQGKSESESTGLLEKNVIVTRGKPPQGVKGERYIVRVKRKTYARKSGRPVSTAFTARALEHGTSQQAAEPWLRPAARSKAREAIATIERELVRDVERIANKLGRR